MDSICEAFPTAGLSEPRPLHPLASAMLLQLGSPLPWPEMPEEASLLSTGLGEGGLLSPWLAFATEAALHTFERHDALALLLNLNFRRDGSSAGFRSEGTQRAMK